MNGVLTFSQALDASSAQKNRHVLLGNGFSIACRSDIFVYSRLFERANFDDASERVREAFDALGTTDFERVIRALRDFARLVRVFIDDPGELPTEILVEADTLKEILVRTIASSHPDRPSDITDDEYLHCRTFLNNFKRVFTVNYDLLLYWTLMHREIEPRIPCDDGFRKPEDNSDAEYVTWEPENTYSQNIYYLHGALHIFDAGVELQKYTWINTGIALIDQIRDALERNYFPLFVAEGTSDEKLQRVRHSDFLSKAHRGLRQITGALFTYGHSLAENDDHILRLISRGRTSQLFVSLYGDQNSDSNRFIIRRAREIVATRPSQRPLELHFYSADSASVWR